jgi:hypothetical protein
MIYFYGNTYSLFTRTWYCAFGWYKTRIQFPSSLMPHLQNSPWLSDCTGSRRVQIFHKVSSHLRILRASWVAWQKFNTENQQIFGATKPNLVVCTPWHSGLLVPDYFGLDGPRHKPLKYKFIQIIWCNLSFSLKNIPSALFQVFLLWCKSHPLRRNCSDIKNNFNHLLHNITIIS